MLGRAAPTGLQRALLLSLILLFEEWSPSRQGLFFSTLFPAWEGVGLLVAEMSDSDQAGQRSSQILITL